MSTRNSTEFIVIHCAATRPSMNIGAAEIDKWHRSRGFRCIGYHFVIRRNGLIEDGRPMGDQGAHVKRYNRVSVGVCMVGGVTEDDVTVAEDNFTEDQWISLGILLEKLRAHYPAASIVAHHELDAGKACPSFDVRQYVDAKGFFPLLEDAPTPERCPTCSRPL
jgi:N-acetylmuramoyl-L-alanine amidase